MPNPKAPSSTISSVSEQVEDLQRRVDRTHKLLEQHMEEEAAERQQRRLRYDGIMSLLQDLVARTP